MGERLEEQDREELLLTARRLLAETQALSIRIAAVNEIATAINRTLDLNQILRVVGKQAKWLLDFEHCSVCLHSSSSCTTLFGKHIPIEIAALPDSSPINKAFKTRQPQLIQEAGATAILSPYSSQIILPLESEGKVLGTINFATTKPRSYTQEDLRIGYLLALQLSSAIRNAERFKEMNNLYLELDAEKHKSDQLLLNVLPVKIAEELKNNGKVEPVHYDCVSVLFTDFQDFTKLSEKMTPRDLVDELDYCFSYFDRVMDKYCLEKLKTIGDSYMCAAGIPVPRATHAFDAVLGALEIQQFMELRKVHKAQQNIPYWDIRIGIHSGPILAGVIGNKKFAYDVWGDTVNTASRMESSGVPGKINISSATFELVKDFCECEYRGKIFAKNKGEMDMYLVNHLK
ncbi:GAF domain-containing protein [Tychonema sp. LEGE 07199]|uniref:adenylate/guanylate cyclase domain-containing protein n=1 Tax=unclassified Tychonema TaxID=2642144 RepID=UPI0018813C14|nr:MULTISPECIES: adenylate/guanylate cyclase domain-containing protein [unclassified Tychonema]MBE9121099.1 GAF domain-containing protein [Tychonema sp. LEGE 07199]MBE9134501.1 GAF domain-containing protein [Tychonema sp. LEGE 07196]